MTENKELLSQNGIPSNGCIVAAIADVNSNHDNNKLKNCSNGMVNGITNSIHLKANNTLNKNKFDFDNHANEQLSTSTIPSTEPPDGGARAWCVMISAFFCNSIIFGIINTFGTIYIEIHKNLMANNDSEAGSKAGNYHYRIKFAFQVFEKGDSKKKKARRAKNKKKTFKIIFRMTLLLRYAFTSPNRFHHFI